MKKHCVGCHGSTKPKADLSLHVYVDEATLLKDRKKWPDVLKMVESGEMPPKGKPRPTPAEVADFVNSVKGAFDRADKNAKPDPGRVTVRRLNKAEFNNTIRDLIGVDFNASEDFPSDDVGNGFDNIGDVLTLSPVLMERYLAAAETIVNRAIVVNPPKPPVRYVNASDLQPGGSTAKFRPIVQGGQKGALQTTLSVSQEGEYTLKVKCYAKQAGDEPTKVALLLDGKELKTFAVKSTSEKSPDTFEIRLTLPAGPQRGAVQLVNELSKPKEPEAKKDKVQETKKDSAPKKDPEVTKDKEERILYVEALIFEGPHDGRPAFQRKNLTLVPTKPKAEQTRHSDPVYFRVPYRRPATKDEIDRLVKLVETIESQGRQVEKRGCRSRLRRSWCRPNSSSVWKPTARWSRQPDRRLRSTTIKSHRDSHISSGRRCPTMNCSRTPWRRSNCTPTSTPRSSGCSKIRRPRRSSTTSSCNGSSCAI